MFVYAGDNYTRYHIHHRVRFTLILWILLLLLISTFIMITMITATSSYVQIVSMGVSILDCYESYV
jgi:competence protein ComGC